MPDENVQMEKLISSGGLDEVVIPLELKIPKY